MNRSRTLSTYFASLQTIRAPWLFVIIVASFIAPLQASAQYIGHGVSEEGNLPTTNFGTRDYRAHSQNWAIAQAPNGLDRKSTRLNSSHVAISYAVFCL